MDTKENTNIKIRELSSAIYEVISAIQESRLEWQSKHHIVATFIYLGMNERMALDAYINATTLRYSITGMPRPRLEFEGAEVLRVDEINFIGFGVA